MLRPEPKMYEGETQISGSGIIKGTVKDQRLHGRRENAGKLVTTFCQRRSSVREASDRCSRNTLKTVFRRGRRNWGRSHQDHSGGIGDNAFPLHSRGTCLRRAMRGCTRCKCIVTLMRAVTRAFTRSAYARSNVGPRMLWSVDGV